MSALILPVPRASSTRPKQTSNYTFEKNQVLRKHPPSCVRSHTLFAWVTRSLCVCLRMRGRSGCVARPAHSFFFVPARVVCHHINPLMRVPSRGVGSLRLTALWQSEWRWGQGAPPQLWHLCQCCDREASPGAKTPCGPGAQRDRGGGSAGASGKPTDTQILLHCCLPLNTVQGKGKRGMRWEESHLLSFIHSQGIAVDVTPAHTLVYTHTRSSCSRLEKVLSLLQGEGSWRGLHSTCRGLEYRTVTHKGKEKPQCHNQGSASIQTAN